MRRTNMYKKAMIEYLRKESWKLGVDEVAVGQELKSRRKALNLTLEDMVDLFEAAGIEITVQALAKREKGSLPNSKNYDHWKVYAAIFNCTVDELLIGYGFDGDGSSLCFLWDMDIENNIRKTGNFRMLRSRTVEKLCEMRNHFS